MASVKGAKAQSKNGMANKDSAIGGHSGDYKPETGIQLPKAQAELKADKNLAADPCESYVKELVASVQERILCFLKGQLAVGGFNPSGTLQQQQPLKINGSGTLQTTKEHWQWEN